MATLTQMENFEAEIHQISPGIAIDSGDDGYVRLEPSHTLARYAVIEMCMRLAKKYGLQFDGFDENGKACFINPGDI